MLMTLLPQNIIGRCSGLEESLVHDLLKEAHEVLQTGIRCCLDKSYLQATEAKVFRMLGEYSKAKNILLESHKNNPSSVRTTILLGRLLVDHQEHELANGIVTETRKYNRKSRGVEPLGC